MLENISNDEDREKVTGTKTQVLNRIKLIQQKSATKNDVKKEPEEVVIKTNETEKEEIQSGESSDTPEIPQTGTTKKDKEGWESKEGDAYTAPVTEPQAEILERASFHEQSTDGNEGDITKEVVEESKESVIDEKPENDINTDSKQEQVNTKSAAPNKSHNALVAEDRVQKTNAIETTTIELFATDSEAVNITGTLKDIEPAAVKNNSKEEKNETITANANLESGPNPLTCESDEYLVAGEVIATVSNSKISKKKPNTPRMGGKSSIPNEEVSKEPDPTSNQEQVKELQSKAEKLITNENSESHTNDKDTKIHKGTEEERTHLKNPKNTRE